MTMCHLKKHIEYMQATCHMLIDGVSNNCHSLDWRMDVGSIQELVTEVNNLDEVTSRLRTQVTELKHKVSLYDLYIQFVDDVVAIVISQFWGHIYIP